MNKKIHVLVLIGIVNYFDVASSLAVKKNAIANEVYSRCIQPGTIALTFDDGPSTLTPSVLDMLRGKNVQATFFINGLNSMNIESESAKTIVRRTASEGHLICSHGWIHTSMTNMTLDELTFQLVQLDNKIYDILGTRIRNMRPPFGHRNATVDEIVIVQLGYKIILWSIDSMDWSHPGDTAAGLQEYIKILNGTDPATTRGFIALNHDPQRGSAELVDAVVDYVRSIGYRFVTLKECLGLA